MQHQKNNRRVVLPILDLKIKWNKWKSYLLLHPTKVGLGGCYDIATKEKYFNYVFLLIKGKAIAAASKAQHQRSRPQVSIYSSDDDGPPVKTQTVTKRVQNDTKKKAVTSNKSKAPVTGGKGI